MLGNVNDNYDNASDDAGAGIRDRFKNPRASGGWSRELMRPFPPSGHCVPRLSNRAVIAVATMVENRIAFLELAQL